MLIQRTDNRVRNLRKADNQGRARDEARLKGKNHDDAFAIVLVVLTHIENLEHDPPQKGHLMNGHATR